MLREAVEIMRRMWTEDEVTYSGKYYQLEGAINQPKPVQEPHLPLWIAGGGEQLTLRIAAEYADYTNFGVHLDEFIHKSEVLRGHCADAGTNFDGIVRSTNFLTVCEETEADVADRLGWIRDHYSRLVPEDRAEATVQMHKRFAGTPEQLIEKLRPWADAGADYTILYFAESATDTSGMERFAAEVIPASN